MLTFDEYYGYKNKEDRHYEQDRHQTENSARHKTESAKKKDRRKKKLDKDQGNQERSHNSFESSFRKYRKTIKSNPFKHPNQKQKQRQKKTISSQKHPHHPNQVRHFFDRYEREDFSKNNQQFIQRKDSLILKILSKKNTQRNNEHSVRNSKNKKFKSLSIKKNIVGKTEDRKKITNQNFEKDLKSIKSIKQVKNPEVNGSKKVQKKYQQSITSTASFNHNKALQKKKETEVQKNGRKSKQIKQKYKCSIDANKKVKKNQKQETQNKRMVKKIPQLKKFDSFGQTSLALTLKLGQSIEGRCKNHYDQIRRLLNYTEEKCEDKQTKMRQFFLCKKLYYKELKKMKEYLFGNQNAQNCFILEKASISESEIDEYRFSESNNLSNQIIHFQKQLRILQQILKQQSMVLVEKDKNDPYVDMESQNFQTQLINQIFSQINFLNQKIVRSTQKKKQNLLKRRKDGILLVVLIAELCRFKKQAQKFIPVENVNQIFDDNVQALGEILDKFQQMPL